MSLDDLAVEYTNPAFYIQGIDPDLIYHPETIEARWAHFDLAKADFDYFAEKCCGFDLEAFHLEWVEATEKYDRVMRMCAREHGKTTTLNILRNLWKLVHNPAYQIYMYSATGFLSKQLLNRHDAFMDLPYFNDPIIFGCDLLKNRRSKSGWNTDGHKFGNGSFLIGMGFESATRGPHPHDVVCDDVLSDRLKLTNDGVIDLFRKALSNMPTKRLIVVGTPQHKNDLLHELLVNPRYNSKTYPAIINEETQEVLWEKEWSWEKLQDKKIEIGELAFSQEYLCNPIDDSASLFPRDIMEACYDYVQYPPLHINLGAPRDSDSVYAIGVDLAIGLSSQASYTVATVLQQKKIKDKKHIIIAEIIRERTDRHERQADIIEGLEAKYKPVLTYLENNAFQKYLEQIIQDRKATSSVEGFKTGTEKHQTNVGVPSLRQRFENKTFIIPRGIPEGDQRHDPIAADRTLSLTKELLNELVGFTEKDGKVVSLAPHTDMVMSLWLALSAMREVDSKTFKHGYLEL